MVAYALEADIALLPYLPELLADLQELGSDARAITRVLEELGLAKSQNVVDLGCGKGAVAVEVAEKLGLEVLGIELFEPFIESCLELARLRNVSELCRFRRGDILQLAGKIEPRDVAIFAALGDVLGSLEKTVSIIRRYTRPGGYMVISDGYIREGGSADFPGFGQYGERDEMLARLIACGDTLIREVINAADFDQGASALIAARARTIAARQPEIAAKVHQYANAQAAEYDFLNENFVGAIWVLRRA